MNVLRQLLLILFLLCLQNQPLFAQRVTALKPDIQIDSILSPQQWASKLAQDPISKNLFYACSNGNIYEVFEATHSDTLRFSSLDHGIFSLQGLCFLDSTMFLCGNIWYNTIGFGLIMKGVLQPTGSRIWSTVLTTEAYPTGSANGDHGFTALNIDPTKQYLFLSSGSRTSFGEIETNNGAHPGLREQALTSKIFRIPIDAANLYLLNDSVFLENSGYVFAEGTRNAYDMAWNAQNHLFAIDNAGERDDPEELNWIQQGKHYGFPWRIGGNQNPLLNPQYDATQDPLINPQNSAFLAGHFNADPTFPLIPSGLQFTEPLANYGNAADYYKDELTGNIHRASETGVPIKSFTPHRSPLGLVIDKDKALGSIYSGKAFVLSFMPGGDSSGFSPISPWGSPCPFVDNSRELVMLQIQYDSLLQDYFLHSSDVVTGFYLPVDAEQIGSSIYVIENNGVLWRIRFPEPNVIPSSAAQGLFVYPNPISDQVKVYFPNPNSEVRHIEIVDVLGQKVWSSPTFNDAFAALSSPKLSNGTYFISICNTEKSLAVQKVLFCQ